jgi:hypothetical protein
MLHQGCGAVKHQDMAQALLQIQDEGLRRDISSGKNYRYMHGGLLCRETVVGRPAAL